MIKFCQFDNRVAASLDHPLQLALDRLVVTIRNEFTLQRGNLISICSSHLGNLDDSPSQQDNLFTLLNALDIDRLHNDILSNAQT
eukprot:CAMPEP_0113641750 /NCGR_PEP_ID=MMETSP0017_2-20120614/21927_1 /TAXON_ID=2856 /ORGANISM="Cylindrotheca closterium" /LENGTH=84 /DNA_ID=CAMNT_0000553127 /DNA_START=206 /DNA_END=456 /DNA_ORIENTATION=+ /assembly_acc=CAM_ASM_000147